MMTVFFFYHVKFYHANFPFLFTLFSITSNFEWGKMDTFKKFIIWKKKKSLLESMDKTRLTDKVIYSLLIMSYMAWKKLTGFICCASYQNKHLFLWSISTSIWFNGEEVLISVSYVHNDRLKNQSCD